VSRPASLSAWLAYLETLHPKAIALGLDRVRAVHAPLDAPIACPVVTVGGTNGKGSTCAMLEAILRCAGFVTGLYASPHLLRYNERVRIGGAEVSDGQLVDAFNAVEDARLAAAGVPLTYFEFGTLAALWTYARARLDSLILEVGLGGRLDAVNIVDADVAVLTSIDIDHVDYLGPTREDIGREKAGIFRANRPAVCGDRHPPASVLQAARDSGARLVQLGRDYDYVDERTQWRYRGPRGERFGLPMPALRGAYQLANAATALAVLDLLHDRLPTTAQAVREGLLTVSLPGRFQVLPGRPTTVLDVAHNPHAARALADALGSMGYHPETIAVCAMLADKDAKSVVAALRPRVDRWFVAGLPGPRGDDGKRLRDALLAAGVTSETIRVFADVAQAYAAARDAAGEADRIVVFGSFLTVAAAMP
jgi:dihydrofolate synthase/folylpolyglutamate synthase